jgi:hypothetical protein
MSLSEEDIQKIADSLFKKLMEQQEKFDQENNIFIVSDEFGNSKNVEEVEYLHFELMKLESLLDQYIKEEMYEKANVLNNKIRILRSKIEKL